MDISPVIALVDENCCARDALATLLSSDGYGLEVYESTQEFLTHAALSRASCVVVNAQTGGVLSMELSRRLAAAGLALPILILKATEQQSLMKQATQFGCLAFLRRPAETAWLLDSIAEAVVQATSVAEPRISLA